MGIEDEVNDLDIHKPRYSLNSIPINNAGIHICQLHNTCDYNIYKQDENGNHINMTLGPDSSVWLRTSPAILPAIAQSKPGPLISLEPQADPGSRFWVRAKPCRPGPVVHLSRIFCHFRSFLAFQSYLLHAISMSLIKYNVVFR